MKTTKRGTQFELHGVTMTVIASSDGYSMVRSTEDSPPFVVRNTTVQATRTNKPK
tara:strand:+ start:940 stop:1104 length:165 start_codon:yes stop_codon:yes gene_type:complete